MIWDLNVNGKGVEGAGKNNHVWDVCADRYKISMHTVPLTPAPAGLFGGNLMPFFSLNICHGGIKQKWILRVCRSFHLAVSGGIVKADSVYRSLEVTAFRNLHLLVPSSLGDNKRQLVCVNQLVAGFWTPVPQGEDPIITLACCAGLPREQQSLRHHAQI